MRRNRFFLGDHPLARQIDGDSQSGAGGALAVAGLEQIEAPALDGELDVLHVAVVHFEALHSLAKLAEHRWHRFLHRRRGVTHFVARVRGQRLWRADAGHHVLTLGVDQEFAVQARFSPVAGSRVKATPVALVSPMLPNTMDWTLTAVPQASGMSCMRR